MKGMKYIYNILVIFLTFTEITKYCFFTEVPNCIPHDLYPAGRRRDDIPHY